MRNFLSYLSEAVEATKKLKHLTHVEDHVTGGAGAEGFEHAKKTLQSVHSHITGEGETNGVKVTEKFDGAPSIVFGHHPVTKKFFVATKSAFNKNPKINYTPEDIERNHGHAPGLAKKLKEALEHLSKVAPKEGIHQGDMLFGEGDVETAGGQHHFTPQAVTHSVDANSSEGRAVKKSKVGVVVHTKYEEDPESNEEWPGNLNAGFNVNHDAFKPHKDVYRVNPEMHFNGQYTPTQRKTFQMHMRNAQAHHNALGKDGYRTLEGHEDHMATYINSTVRNGTKPSVQGYKAHLADKQAREVASVKQEKTKEIKRKHHQDLIDSVEKNKKQFDHALQAHHSLRQAKNQLVNALSTHNRGIAYSIKGEKSRPEGFVATLKNKKGESLASKLIDREPGGFAERNLAGAGKFQKAVKK